MGGARLLLLGWMCCCCCFAAQAYYYLGVHRLRLQGQERDFPDVLLAGMMPHRCHFDHYCSWFDIYVYALLNIINEEERTA